MKKAPSLQTLPPSRDWRTTDEDELNRRRIRGCEEKFTIRNQRPGRPVFSNFLVDSRSGMRYSVEIRDIAARCFSCTCADFRKNGLGTCKHVEAVLRNLEQGRPRAYKAAAAKGSDLIEVALDAERDTLRVEQGLARLPLSVKRLFDAGGRPWRGSAPRGS